jgi:aarF domain-containing kinase
MPAHPPHPSPLPPCPPGPAFIKWGQWASTRPDLFPQDLCAALEKLQTKAPSHSPLQSVAAVEAAFQCRIDQLFDEFELEPVASGGCLRLSRAACLKHSCMDPRVNPTVCTVLCAAAR